MSKKPMAKRATSRLRAVSDELGVTSPKGLRSKAAQKTARRARALKAR
jgi:hypothetical protein